MEVKERSGFIPALLFLAIVLVVAMNWDAFEARLHLFASASKEFTRADWSGLAKLAGCAFVTIAGALGFCIVVASVIRRIAAPPRKVTGNAALERFTHDLRKR